MSIKLRIELEKRIVTQVVDDALAAGYSLSADDAFGGEELFPITTDRQLILDNIFAGDDALMYLYKGESGIIIRDNRLADAWVKFIYGNDGYDVISDYTVNLEQTEVLKKANEISEQYAN